jgi:hypothetical protein
MFSSLSRFIFVVLCSLSSPSIVAFASEGDLWRVRSSAETVRQTVFPNEVWTHPVFGVYGGNSSSSILRENPNCMGTSLKFSTFYGRTTLWCDVPDGYECTAGVVCAVEFHFGAAAIAGESDQRQSPSAVSATLAGDAARILRGALFSPSSQAVPKGNLKVKDDEGSLVIQCDDVSHGNEYQCRIEARSGL